MKTSPTRRGLALLAATLALLLLGYASRDAVILYGSFALLLVPAADYLYLATVYRRRCYCEVERREHTVWVWERRAFKLLVRCAGFSRLGGLPGWLKVTDVSTNGEVTTVELEAFFDHHGTFSLKELTVIRRFLGFFELLERASVGVSFKVYPETAYWVLRAANLLGLRVRAVEGAGPPSTEVVSEVVTAVKSKTGDYVGSREYAPGDAVDRIDWKATARLQSLYVKEFSGGEDEGLTVIFDDTCYGPYTCDRVASLLLSLILNPEVRSARALRVIDARTGKAVDARGWTDLVHYSLRKVFELEVVEPDALYEYVEPATAAELAKVLRKASYGLKSVEHPPRSGYHVAISVLSGSAGQSMILEYAETLRSNLIVMAPSRPWLDFGDLSYRYSIYTSLEHVISKLKKLGCKILLYETKRSGAGR